MTLKLPAEVGTVNISYMAMTDSGGYWEAPTWTEVDYDTWLLFAKTERRIELVEVV